MWLNWRSLLVPKYYAKENLPYIFTSKLQNTGITHTMTQKPQISFINHSEIKQELNHNKITHVTTIEPSIKWELPWPLLDKPPLPGDPWCVGLSCAWRYKRTLLPAIPPLPLRQKPRTRVSVPQLCIGTGSALYRTPHTPAHEPLLLGVWLIRYL